MGEKINIYENLGMDVQITLKWMLGKQGGKLWTGFIWLMTPFKSKLVNTIKNLRVLYKAGHCLNM
jgi:hypothetical protein